MQQANFIKKDNHFGKIVSLQSSQANAWGAGDNILRQFDSNTRQNENQQTIGRLHACRASHREFQRARDRLKRANRDLGETAAFIAASLTTATAIQAVISIANDKLESSRGILQMAFNTYVVIFVLILVLGAFRATSAIRRRAKAEKDIDQTKKWIFDYCPMDEWPKVEE
jgi:hypothetical protein